MKRVQLLPRYKIQPYTVLDKLEINDMKDCPTVWYKHPKLNNMDYFLIEYARALRVDMIRFPLKYGTLTINEVYHRVARAIIDNEVKATSPALRYACRVANIPETRSWIQAYIWYDYPIDKEFVIPYSTLFEENLIIRINATKLHCTVIRKLNMYDIKKTSKKFKPTYAKWLKFFTEHPEFRAPESLCIVDKRAWEHSVPVKINAAFEKEQDDPHRFSTYVS